MFYQEEKQWYPSHPLVIPPSPSLTASATAKLRLMILGTTWSVSGRPCEYSMFTPVPLDVHLTALCWRTGRDPHCWSWWDSNPLVQWWFSAIAHMCSSDSYGLCCILSLFSVTTNFLLKTSSLSLTSHPTAFPGVLHNHIKSRIRELSCLTCLYLTFSFHLGVYDSQIPFGLQLIPSPSAGFLTLLKIPPTVLVAITIVAAVATRAVGAFSAAIRQRWMSTNLPCGQQLRPKALAPQTISSNLSLMGNNGDNK